MLIWPRNYAALYFNSLAFIILGYTRLSGVTIGLVTGIIGGVEYIRIGHPWFACAHFSTMITPILLALLVDGAAHLVDRKSKVKRHEWSSWRVYVGLIPGVNLVMIGWILHKMASFKRQRAATARDYCAFVNTENDEESEGLDDKSQVIKELATQFKKCRIRYSKYGKEYYYIYCLKAFGSALPQFILQLAFTFRRGFCSDIFLVNCLGNIISFTTASTNVFYLLPKKYEEPLPDLFPILERIKLMIMFTFTNLSRMYVMVYLATHTRFWTYLLYILICALNFVLALDDELVKNPKFTILSILFSPISPCIVSTQCKRTNPILLSLGMTMNLVPFLIN